MPIQIARCAFCERETRTRGHHVVPRSKGGKLVVPTCESCENFIHSTWSHNELRDTWNTVEKVRADERFARFLKWLLKQPVGAVYRSKRNRQRLERRER
jgi:hypothetical protein